MTPVERTRQWRLDNPERAKALFRRYRETNRKKIREKARRNYAANPKRVLEPIRLWNIANPDKKRATQRRYRMAHPEKCAENSKNWWLAHPEKRCMYEAARRARKLAASVPLTAIEKARMQEFYDIAIARTAQTGIQWHVDHDVPLTRGGKHHPDNLVLLPLAMNTAKGNRHSSTMEFLLS